VNSHEAPGQMAGYLYQTLIALIKLLDDKNQDAKICIEKFDDITFFEKEEPRILIQTKHQINKKGNLTNTSVDLWRTINSWCDTIEKLGDSFEETTFIIITTARAKEGSAAYYLKDEFRNPTETLKQLEEVAKSASEATNEKFYKTFLNLDPQKRKKIVSKIKIFDDSIQINGVYDVLKEKLRFGTLPGFEDKVCEKLEGWWIRKVIDCLSIISPVFISQLQLRQKVYDIMSEFKPDSLPIDVDPYKEPSNEDLSILNVYEKLFIHQLYLINVSEDRLKRAIREYYHAYQQRAKWVREELLFIDELENYETKLVDEWNRLFLIMQEELIDYGDQLTDQEKSIKGKALFNQIEDLEIYIREQVTQPFIMRGSYHELANKLTVGWHLDFEERLYHLLKGDPNETLEN